MNVDLWLHLELWNKKPGEVSMVQHLPWGVEGVSKGSSGQVCGTLRAREGNCQGSEHTQGTEAGVLDSFARARSSVPSFPNAGGEDGGTAAGAATQKRKD